MQNFSLKESHVIQWLLRENFKHVYRVAFPHPVNKQRNADCAINKTQSTFVFKMRIKSSSVHWYNPFKLLTKINQIRKIQHHKGSLLYRTSSRHVAQNL